MLLSDNIVGIGNLDGICSGTFVLDEFSGLFLNQSVNSIKQSIST